MKSKINIIYTIIALLSTSMLISADIMFSTGKTGSTGDLGTNYCTGCHGSYSLNAAGGSVTTNLPSTYTPGVPIPFTLTIKHFSGDRKRWGFAVKAVAAGTTVGTFSTTNTTAIGVAAGEIYQKVAPSTSLTDTYTFNNLTWTPPASPTANQENIKFYFTGNAADGTGGTSLDYIYANTHNMTVNFPASLQEANLSLDNINITNTGKKINIQLTAKQNTQLDISILNLGGQRVIFKPSQKYNTGFHSVSLDADNLSSGTYIILIQNEKGKISRKVTL